MTKKSKKQKAKGLKPQRKKKFWVGKCFKCGHNLGTEGQLPTRGHRDGIPIYIDCPKCRAVNNYKKRYLEWKERYQ